MRRVVTKESFIEKHLLDNPQLPGGEPLLILRRQQPISRLVDLLAIDGEGRLVFIEVKNERTTRTAVGQVMEYLSSFADADFAVLEDEFALKKTGQTLASAFRERFGKELTAVNPRRRAYLVAPTFDTACEGIAIFLRGFSKTLNLELGLVRYTIGPQREVSLAHHEPTPLRQVEDMPLGLAEDRRGRVFAILSHRPAPVLWHVGRFSSRGTLRLPGRAMHRALRFADRKLRPLQMNVKWDQAISGTSYERVGRPDQVAKIIGAVVGRRKKGESVQWIVVYAFFRGGALVGFRKRPLRAFRQRWKKSRVTLPDWHSCLTHADAAMA
jgi:hypothetical protein